MTLSVDRISGCSGAVDQAAVAAAAEQIQLTVCAEVSSNIEKHGRFVKSAQGLRSALQEA